MVRIAESHLIGSGKRPRGGGDLLLEACVSWSKSRLKVHPELSNSLP